MSNTTIFVALQCCQCSMMQVKQKKKSSNKWTCVVCNQKQSVKKVFAEGYMARDLRQFVQSFNMNRQEEEMMPNKKAKLSSGGEEDCEESGEFYSLNDSKVEVKNKVLKSKWRDYLTPEEEEETMNKNSDHKTQGVMKKQNNAAASKWSELLADDEQKPRGRVMKKQHTMSKNSDRKTQGVMKKQNNAADSKWSELLADEEQKPQDRVMKKQHDAATSKWSDYLTDEEQKTQVAEKRKSFATAEDKSVWRNDDLEIQARDIQVEDDIHPDFL